jgi:hypothetical protein
MQHDNNELPKCQWEFFALPGHRKPLDQRNSDIGQSNQSTTRGR